MAVQTDSMRDRLTVPRQRGDQQDRVVDLDEIVCTYCGRPRPVTGYWGFDVCEDAPDGSHAAGTPS